MSFRATWLITSTASAARPALVPRERVRNHPLARARAHAHSPQTTRRSCIAYTVAHTNMISRFMDRASPQPDGVPVLSFVLPTERVLAAFIEETYGQRLEAAFSVRRSFRRRIRRMASGEVGLPDAKLLRDAKKAKRREERAKAAKEENEEEEEIDDDVEEEAVAEPDEAEAKAPAVVPEAEAKEEPKGRGKGKRATKKVSEAKDEAPAAAAEVSAADAVAQAVAEVKAEKKRGRPKRSV